MMFFITLLCGLVAANETYSEQLKIWRLAQGKNLLAYTFDFSIKEQESYKELNYFP